MEKLVDEGLVRSIGVSNYTSLLLLDALNYSRIPPAVNQIERHPYLTQREHIQFCKENDVNVTAYSPLGAPGGPGKGAKDPLLENKVVQGIAKKHGKTAAQVLIRFHVDSNVIVIPKSVSQ